MQNIDIFAQGKKVDAVWAKFDQIGKGYQGTYIGQKTAIDTFNNPQIIYELLQTDGTIVNVGVAERATRFHDKMKHVRLGQIIGIKYTENVPIKGKPADKPMKLLSLFADPKIVNQEWIDMQKDALQMQQGDQTDQILPTEDLGNIFSRDNSGQEEKPISVENLIQVDEPFPSRELTDSEKIKKITEFARLKLGVTDASSMPARIQEATDYAFTTNNLDKIIESLQRM